MDNYNISLAQQTYASEEFYNRQNGVMVSAQRKVAKKMMKFGSPR